VWIPNSVFALFTISKETVEALRTENAALHAEAALLKSQLSVSQNQFDWLRTRVNVLEMERAQLVKQAYNIDTPVPEIQRRPDPLIDQLNQFTFADMGDEMAKKLGLPTYDS
jgi:predicted nuclease with TOPRIM domain